MACTKTFQVAVARSTYICTLQDLLTSVPAPAFCYQELLTQKRKHIHTHSHTHTSGSHTQALKTHLCKYIIYLIYLKECNIKLAMQSCCKCKIGNNKSLPSSSAGCGSSHLSSQPWKDRGRTTVTSLRLV